MAFEDIDRKVLLEQIQSERKILEAALDQVDHQAYLEPLFAGGWSIKDVLAHLVAWEQRMITWVGQAAEGVLPEMPGSEEAVDDLNTQSYQQTKDLPLEEVLKAYEVSYPQALAVAEHTPEEVLFTHGLIEGRENPFWITVAANTCWHYKEHREALDQVLSNRDSISK